MSWLRPKWMTKGGAKPANAPARIPSGRICYAIGDIHGRLDLLRILLKKIDADAAVSPGQLVNLVFLGDYLDRGPDSSGVVDLLTVLKRDGGEHVSFLKGNHEEALLGFLADPTTGATWAEHGGRETLKSYAVDPPRNLTDAQGWQDARDAFALTLPPEHLSFLRDLQLFTTVGDYLFVHAGVRPGVPLELQDPYDLLWIRKDFMDAPRPLEERIVVHGHTPHSEPALAAGRIGIDTGAYATGVLTAIRLEDDRRSFIRTGV